MNTQVMFSSQTDNWATPQWLFDELNKEFSFTIDVCANSDNAKCRRYYTKAQDGLKQNWGGGRMYFAILLMAERLANGLRKQVNLIPLWLCSYLQEQIQSGFTNISTIKQK